VPGLLSVSYGHLLKGNVDKRLGWQSQSIEKIKEKNGQDEARAE